MRTFLLRRIALSISQLFILSILIFILAKMMPGDALTGAIQENPSLSAETVHALREKLGLFDPWYVQYFHWLGNLIQGDLGQSYLHKVAVTSIIGSRIVNTFWLGLASLLLTYFIAIPLGVISGRYEDTLADRTITTYSYVTYAIPSFVFALLMLFVFGFWIHWFPTSGSVAPDVAPGTFAFYISKFYHLVLPTITVSLLQTTTIVQFLRSEVIDHKRSDFVKLARSKGISESKIYRRHILRNAFLPIAAFLGLDITGVLAGDIFLEQIFGYPGIGQLFISSINSRDFSVVTGLLMISGALTLLGTILSDLILSWVDPRIRIK